MRVFTILYNGSPSQSHFQHISHAVPVSGTASGFPSSTDHAAAAAEETVVAAAVVLLLVLLSAGSQGGPVAGEQSGFDPMAGDACTQHGCSSHQRLS